MAGARPGMRARAREGCLARNPGDRAASARVLRRIRGTGMMAPSTCPGRNAARAFGNPPCWPDVRRAWCIAEPDLMRAVPQIRSGAGPGSAAHHTRRLRYLIARPRRACAAPHPGHRDQRSAAVRTRCFQNATSRSRKNLKNSIPSRSRRFIISGLLTISPTIEAIFGARK
jgi:hypothetical protein